MPRLYELYPGICLTNEEKARENFSQGRSGRNAKCVLYSCERKKGIVILSHHCFVCELDTDITQSVTFVRFIITLRGAQLD